MEVKELDFNNPFIANGRTYRVKTRLSVARWIQFEIAQIELAHGVSFADMIKNWQTAYDLANKMKLADIAVLAHNQLTSIATRLEDRTHPVLKICSLFVNYDGEDEIHWDEDLVKEKQNDWTEEGYSMQDFFQLAYQLVPQLLAVLDETSLSTSKKAKDESKELNISEQYAYE